MNSSTSGMPPWNIKYPLYGSRSVISPAMGASIRSFTLPRSVVWPKAQAS